MTIICGGCGIEVTKLGKARCECNCGHQWNNPRNEIIRQRILNKIGEHI